MTLYFSAHSPLDQMTILNLFLISLNHISPTFHVNWVFLLFNYWENYGNKHRNLYFFILITTSTHLLAHVPTTSASLIFPINCVHVCTRVCVYVTPKTKFDLSLFWYFLFSSLLWYSPCSLFSLFPLLSSLLYYYQWYLRVHLPLTLKKQLESMVRKWLSNQIAVNTNARRGPQAD